MIDNNTTRTVTFIGNAAVDSHFVLPSWPALGDKQVSGPRQRVLGGDIGNACAVYGGLGGSAMLVCNLRSKSEISELIRADMEALGVNTSHILHRPDAPDVEVIVFSTGDDNVVIIPERTDPEIVLDNEIFEAIASTAYIYTTLKWARQLRYATARGSEVIQAFREAGVRVLLDLDTAVDADLLDEYAGVGDIIMLNSHGYTRAFEDTGVDWLFQRGVSSVVTTAGAEGAQIRTEDHVINAPALSIPPVDTTGAGDTFGAAYLFAVQHGSELSVAAAFANAAAARCVSTFGPRSGVGTAQNVLDFATRHGYASNAFGSIAVELGIERGEITNE